MSECTSIRLISGVLFDYEAPFNCAAITAHDIAHGLARTSRFTGQCLSTYSVADHTLFVAYLVTHYYKQPRLAMAALHHDDVEAFTGDWPTPLKRMTKDAGFDYVRELERPIEAAVCQHLGLPLDDLHAGVVRDADRLALAAESTVLKPGTDASNFSDIDDDVLAAVMVNVPHGHSAPMSEAAWLGVHHVLDQSPTDEEILRLFTEGPDG